MPLRYESGISERKKMIDPKHKLSITGQAKALKISRNVIYYKPVPESEETLELMEIIDRLHVQSPYAGSRMLRDMLRNMGYRMGRKRTRTLMRKMGIEALYQRPKTTLREKKHKVYPYALQGLEITKPNQVWAMDITYIPMARGFCYLVAVLDWATRKILSWRLSNTMTNDFCIEAFEDAVQKFGAPSILNTDQGSQFTSHAFVKTLTNNRVWVSMDGKGAWKDNVFIERFWRTIKYEEVYLFAYEDLREGRERIGQYIEKYNTRRPHQKHKGKTPDHVYFNNLPA